jgi:hypothetical protein
MSILSLSEYKAITNTTTSVYDSFVTNIIPYVQAGIEDYLLRKLDAADYYSWYPFSGNYLLDEYPINSIKFIGAANRLASIESITVYNVEVATTGINITSPSFVTTSFAYTLFATLSALKTAVEAYYPDITFSIQDSSYDSISYHCLRTGIGNDIYGATPYSVQARLEDMTNRSLILTDLSSWLFAGDTYPEVFIAYNAGYTAGNYPKGLQTTCAFIIRDMIDQLFGGGKTGVKSETLEYYSYTLTDNAVNQIHRYVEKYYSDLEIYRKKVI